MERSPTPEEFLAICDVMYTYATALDTRDWALFQSIFAEEVDTDFSSIGGPAPTRVTAGEWAGGGRPMFLGLEATHHAMSNPRITVDGDSATCVIYLTAEHVLDEGPPSRRFTIAGYYTNRLVRRPDGWKIAVLRLTRQWDTEGTREMMAEALERGSRRSA